MKRVGPIIGVLGGVAAVIWAMRDRFVTIASPPEPEPPTFRVVSTPPPPPAPTASASTAEAERDDVAHSSATTFTVTPTPDPDDLTAINGVGPVFERRLMEAGLATFSALAESDVERIVRATGVAENRAEDWIRQARLLQHD